MAIYYRGQLAYTTEEMGQVVVGEYGSGGVGSAYSLSVPTGYIYEIINVHFKVVINQVGNHYPFMSVRRGALWDLCRWQVQTPLNGAGSTWTFWLTQGFPEHEIIVNDGVQTAYYGPVPENFVAYPYNIIFSPNPAANNQITDLYWTVRQWRVKEA
jgi:hypothetical protein